MNKHSLSAEARRKTILSIVLLSLIHISEPTRH